MLDFTKVLSIDGGATAGVVDGVGFALQFDTTLTINIINIQVCRLYNTVYRILSTKKTNSANLLGLGARIENAPE